MLLLPRPNSLEAYWTELRGARQPLAAFDIETIPDPDIGRRVYGLEGDDATVVHEMVKLRLEETEGSTVRRRDGSCWPVTMGCAPRANRETLPIGPLQDP